MATLNEVKYFCNECSIGPFLEFSDLQDHISLAHKERLVATNKGVQIQLPTPIVRTFHTGANRDVDTNKYDYEAFLSPLVLEKFAEYMHKNRFLKDGSMRDGDNWQKGIPIDVYMKSLARHFMATWLKHRKGQPVEFDDLCAMMFNVQGLILEHLKAQNVPTPT